jgi:Pvc16 N-terminal domain
MAGFRSVAAVGRSIEAVLNAAYTAEQPTDDTQTHAVLVQTEDLEPNAGNPLISRPALSILLYRVDFNKTTRAGWSSIGSRDGRAHLPLDLHYLLTAWATNADDEHRIIGRTMQVLEGLGALGGPLLFPEGAWAPDETVQLYLEDMATDDLMRTFDSLPCDFRLSIPYIARVVVMAGEGSPVPDVLTFVRGLRPDAGARMSASGLAGGVP